jgi:hypothetical protein
MTGYAKHESVPVAGLQVVHSAVATHWKHPREGEN